MSNADLLDLLPVIGWGANYHSWYLNIIEYLIITPVLVCVLVSVLRRKLDLPWPIKFWGFFPGDGFLAISLLMFVLLTDGYLAGGSDRWWHNPLWNWAVVLIAVVFVVGGRRKDKTFYSPRQRVAPSKLYHDFVVVAGYVYLLVGVGIPGLVSAEWSAVVPNLYRVFGLLAVALWGGCVWYDASNKKRYRKLANASHRDIWPFNPLYDWQMAKSRTMPAASAA